MWFLVLLGAGLGALLLADAIAESERRRQLAPPDKTLERLLTSVATGVQMTARDSAPGVLDAYTLCQLYIRPGQEVFTPPLPKGKRVKLIFTGACAVKQSSSPWYGVDVWYSADTHDHNYRHRHHKLLLDGKTPAKDPIEEDRADHRYVFVYEATGGRLAVLLDPPIIAIDTDATTGTIQLCVVSLTKTEESDLGFGRAERKREEELHQRALELAVLAHLEQNFLDPEYRQRYAQKYQSKILSGLKSEWLGEYHQVLGDEPLHAVIEEQHPHILPFLEARLEVIRIAERLAVEPPPPPPPAPEPPPSTPKPRLTREQWEAKIEHNRQRQVDRLRVDADDRIAKMLERFESARRLRERAEQLGLDDDTIDRLEQELLGDLDQEEEHSNGYKQL